MNVASVHAKATKKNFVSYSTSKTALVGLTRSLALDLAPDVRVNALAPAAIDTPMLRKGFEGKEKLYQQLKEYHPVERIADPKEIAQLLCFLALESCSFLF